MLTTFDLSLSLFDSLSPHAFSPPGSLLLHASFRSSRYLPPFHAEVPSAESSRVKPPHGSALVLPRVFSLLSRLTGRSCSSGGESNITAQLASKYRRHRVAPPLPNSQILLRLTTPAFWSVISSRSFAGAHRFPLRKFACHLHRRFRPPRRLSVA
ncbi:hypothetical protein NL676_028433 [Syzygium grande]|nr:hypothetical protein NL676_028433 [Syzygium grande]